MKQIDECKYKLLDIKCMYDDNPPTCKGDDLWCIGYSTYTTLKDYRESKKQKENGNTKKNKVY